MLNTVLTVIKYLMEQQELVGEVRGNDYKMTPDFLRENKK